jgi:general secretion pathway protein N
MSRPYAWLGLALGVYLIATLASFPAATAYHWFAPDELRLAGIDGTVWRGRATLGSVSRLSVEDVQWQISPWSLVTGTIAGRVELRLADGFASTRFSIGRNAIRASELQATTSVTTLSRLVPLGDVRGLVSVQLAEIELRQLWPVRAVGQIRLANLEVPAIVPGGTGGLVPLGNYLVSLSPGADATLAGSFEDEGGPLEISGSLHVTPEKAYEISGLVLARPEAPRELVQSLDFFAGAADSSGRRPFGLSGSL